MQPLGHIRDILKIVQHLTKRFSKNYVDKFFNYSPHFSDIFASIAPVAASPLLGYGDLPGSPLSIIDLHGTRDTVVPKTLTQALGIVDVHEHI